MKHIVDTKTGKWFHLDNDYRVWTCSCTEEWPASSVSLCLTMTEELKKEGQLRELDRAIAMKRKQLGLKVGDPLPVERLC